MVWGVYLSDKPNGTKETWVRIQLDHYSFVSTVSLRFASRVKRQLYYYIKVLFSQSL